MIDDLLPPRVMPAPAQQWLSALPPDITDSVMSLRLACAKWMPHPGLNTSEYQASRQVCDHVLDHNVQFATGIAFGIGGTLLVIGVIAACRALIRARAFNRFEDLATYGFLIIVGYVIGSAADGLIALLNSLDWYAPQIPSISAGCVIAAIGLLTALRWHTQTADRVVA